MDLIFKILSGNQPFKMQELSVPVAFVPAYIYMIRSWKNIAWYKFLKRVNWSGFSLNKYWNIEIGIIDTSTFIFIQLAWIKFVSEYFAIFYFFWDAHCACFLYYLRHWASVHLRISGLFLKCFKWPVWPCVSVFHRLNTICSERSES